MSFAGIARRVAKLTVDNSPTILTSFGVVGALTTAYLAGKASFEASDIIRIKEADDYERGIPVPEPKEQIKQRVRLVWKLYIPAMTTGAATVFCIIGANHIGNRRAAGLAAAYTITEKTFEEYKAKVVEKIGEKKEEGIRADIIQDRINANWDDSIEVHGKSTGEICYDKFSDRYVWSTEEKLRSAINDLNRIVLSQGYATVADLYDILNMPALSWSYDIGWSSAGDLVDLKFCSVLTPGGQPVKAFEFDTEPIRNYMRFH